MKKLRPIPIIAHEGEVVLPVNVVKRIPPPGPKDIPKPTRKEIKRLAHTPGGEQFEEGGLVKRRLQVVGAPEEHRQRKVETFEHLNYWFDNMKPEKKEKMLETTQEHTTADISELPSDIKWDDVPLRERRAIAKQYWKFKKGGIVGYQEGGLITEEEAEAFEAEEKEAEERMRQEDRRGGRTVTLASGRKVPFWMAPKKPKTRTELITAEKTEKAQEAVERDMQKNIEEKEAEFKRRRSPEKREELQKEIKSLEQLQKKVMTQFDIDVIRKERQAESRRAVKRAQYAKKTGRAPTEFEEEIDPEVEALLRKPLPRYKMGGMVDKCKSTPKFKWEEKKKWWNSLSDKEKKKILSNKHVEGRGQGWHEMRLDHSKASLKGKMKKWRK